MIQSLHFTLGLKRKKTNCIKTFYESYAMNNNKRKYTVLVVDASGRGAAIVQKYSQSPKVRKIIAVPGNDLMQINSSVPVKIFPDLQTTSVTEMIEICHKEKVDLIDVAQDNAIEAGLVDKLTEEGFRVVGPTREAGQIEWDKAWARDFMKRHKLPIPFYKVFDSKNKAIDFVRNNPNKRFFIKAAGLADGKGAIPAENTKQALEAIDQMEKFGKAGKIFVVEEWLMGEEFSMFAATDGKTFQIVGSAQDHKRLYDADLGPNTGGMGCSTPPFIVNQNIYKQGKNIIAKTIKGLVVEKRPYKGILYLGAIVVKNKVFVIEFNARWGSPEAEVLVPGIKTDMFDLGMHVAQNNLNAIKIKTDGRSRVAVTGALRPKAIVVEREIFGIKEVIRLHGVTLFGTRVKRKRKRYFVSSGRLFHIVGEGKTVIEARQKAYAAMALLHIQGDNLHYRTDIGWRDIERFYL